MYFEKSFDVIMSPCSHQIVLYQETFPQIVLYLNMLTINCQYPLLSCAELDFLLLHVGGYVAGSGVCRNRPNSWTLHCGWGALVSQTYQDSFLPMPFSHWSKPTAKITDTQSSLTTIWRSPVQPSSWLTALLMLIIWEMIAVQLVCYSTVLWQLMTHD